MFIEFDAPTSVQLSSPSVGDSPVSTGLVRCRIEVSHELFAKWRAAIHFHLFARWGTTEGFKRMFLRRYPFGPTSQDLEAFLNDQMGKILIFDRARVAQARADEEAIRVQEQADREQRNKHERWRQTGRS